MYVSVYLPEREVEDFENDVAQADENQNQYIRNALAAYREQRNGDDDQPATPVIEA
jgi:hypothetical protein